MASKHSRTLKASSVGISVTANNNPRSASLSLFGNVEVERNSYRPSKFIKSFSTINKNIALVIFDDIIYSIFRKQE
jgi:hypothetical protein